MAALWIRQQDMTSGTAQPGARRGSGQYSKTAVRAESLAGMDRLCRGTSCAELSSRIAREPPTVAIRWPAVQAANPLQHRLNPWEFGRPRAARRAISRALSRAITFDD